MIISGPLVYSETYCTAAALKAREGFRVSASVGSTIRTQKSPSVPARQTLMDVFGFFQLDMSLSRKVIEPL